MEQPTLSDTKLKENLQSQLYELEMLRSMFSNPGEIKFDDDSATSLMTKYVNDKNSHVPPFVDFTVNLTVDEQKFEICVNLSHEYPEAEPDVFIRNHKMNRTQHVKLNKDCNDHIASIDRGEPCIFSLISWLQENAAIYSGPSNEPSPEGDDLKPSSNPNDEKLTRLWIYSHHIYNKTKRREILALAHELQLTGFCMPGKPGIICVEGPANECAEWWQTIKSMTWKRIVCKVTEDCKTVRFRTFEEVAFQNNGSKSNHMDMGELYRYLDEHHLGFIFKELFGVDGKVN